MVDVRLIVNGQRYGGWQSIQIQRGLEQIAGRFELSLTERWGNQTERRPLHPGDACQISVDGETVITGFIDEVVTDYDHRSHSIRIAGRDTTGDLVDCSAPSFNWKGQTLLQVAEKLCQPFSISVTSDTDIGGAFKSKSDNEGDTVFEILEQASRIRGVLLVSDGQGNLLITRAGQLKATGRLVLGKNIRAGSGRLSLQERFSNYRVKGQQPANAFSEVETSYQVLALSEDSVVTRHRPLTVLAEDPINAAAAQVRADWERNVRAGRSQEIEYTLTGWHDGAGDLWQPNRLVTVADEYLELDGELLIVSVANSLDAGGLLTRLMLKPREALDLVPLPEPEGEASVFG